MKILKLPEENKPKVLWTKKITCPLCGALLEYDNTDVKTKQGRYNDMDEYIVCENCKEWFCI